MALHWGSQLLPPQSSSAPHSHLVSLSYISFPSSFPSDCTWSGRRERGQQKGKARLGEEGLNDQRLAEQGTRTQPKWFGGLKNLNVLPGFSAESLEGEHEARVGR